MVSKKQKLSPKASLPFKTANKFKRQDLHVKQKKARENTKRDDRLRRRREEDKNPGQREERISKNIPATLDRKRVFDEIDQDVGDGLGVSVDAEKLERLKRQRIEEEANAIEEDDNASVAKDDIENDRDSMLSFADDDSDGQGDTSTKAPISSENPIRRATSPTFFTTSTNPSTLAARFPTLFPPSDPTIRPPIPKILITTSLNSTLFEQAKLLTTVFPNSDFVPRSNHRYGHKFSIKEIASFATNRNYTSLIVLKEDAKKPTGLNVIHLPTGPSFHFSISTWVAGKRLPGHGNPTDHVSNHNLVITACLTVLTDPRTHTQQFPHTARPSHGAPFPLTIPPTARNHRQTSNSDSQPTRLHLSAENAVRLSREEGDGEECRWAGRENCTRRRGHTDRVTRIRPEDHIEVEEGGYGGPVRERGGLEMEGGR